MSTLAVQFYDVVLWLHISAVVVGLGPPFAFGLYVTFIARTHPRSVPAVLAAQSLVMRTMVTAGATLALATGIYLAVDRDLFSEPFVGVGILAILVIFGLVHGFFIPNDRRAAEAAEQDIERAGTGPVEFGEEFNRRSQLAAKIGPLTGLIIVLTIYFMTAKPFS